MEPDLRIRRWRLKLTKCWGDNRLRLRVSGVAKTTRGRIILDSMETALEFNWLEHQPVTLEVAGSSPVSVASFFFSLFGGSRALLFASS